MSTSDPKLIVLEINAKSWRQRRRSLFLTMHKTVWAGVAAALVYLSGDLVAGSLYETYSFRDQAISELTAYGSPVRPLMIIVMLTHGVLLVLFGLSIMRKSDLLILRWLGGLLIALGVMGFPTHTVWAMTSRDLEPAFNDTMHIAMSFLWAILMVPTVVLSAIAFRGWFRPFALAMLLLMLGFGVASASLAAGIEENRTPWLGGFERVSAYAYLVWLGALAGVCSQHFRQVVSLKPAR